MRRAAARLVALIALVAVVAGASHAQPPATWLAGGAPTAQARAAIALLQGVASRGLRPDDYDGDALAATARTLATGASSDDGTRARFDAELTRAMARLLEHLHEGRVTPSALGFRLPDAHAALDYGAMARAAATAPDVAAAVAAAEPPYVGYAALLRALARYQALAADATLRAPNAAGRTLRPGDAYADAAALRRLLVAFGDLPNTITAADSTVYAGALVDGVRAFQVRHGLVPDGVLGPATMTALRVPLARRARQIELALERWRWLPDRAPERYVVVNVPAFRLYAFENDPTAGHPLLRMNVIVGQAEGRHHTPVFTAAMREVVFRPYWDVPPSIAQGELIPRLRRNPGLADREGYEIVRGGDFDAQVHAMTRANLDRVVRGTLRLRQRPNDRNALGPVKFVFPNPYNVYLHGTPARQLFAETRRDFSHGCVRIEDPAALAELVLRGQPGWDRAAIDSAMAGARTRRIPVARPWDVFMLYATAIVGDDGVTRFYPDVYGHDAALERALERVVSAERAAAGVRAGYE